MITRDIVEVSAHKIQCKCDGCGKFFIKYRCRLNLTGFIFCSQSCKLQNSRLYYDKPSPLRVTYDRTCKHCGKAYSVTGSQKGTKVDFCSKACSNKYRANKPGKAHSEETKKHLADRQKEYCAAHGNQFNTGKSQGKHTKDAIASISAKNTNKPPRWKGRVFEYSGPMGSFKMRSSYELFYAKWLDEQNIKWEYEPTFRLSNSKMFAPDFRLEDGGIIVEIKGYFAPIGRAKWELFCSDYPDIPKKLLMKADLIKLGMKG